MRDGSRERGHGRAEGRRRATKTGRASGARAAITRSLNRGEETAGGAIEREPRILPGRVLTEWCQSLHAAHVPLERRI